MPHLTCFAQSSASCQAAHNAWSLATELFEDLARMGIITASSLERAYQKDAKLMWRIVRCFAELCELQGQSTRWCLVADEFQPHRICSGLLMGTMMHVISWSPQFRKYLKRYRVGTSQSPLGHYISDLLQDVERYGQNRDRHSLC